MPRISGGAGPFRTGPRSAAFNLVDFLGPFLLVWDVANFQQSYTALQDGWQSDPVSYEICCSLVCADVLALVDEWILAADDPAARAVIGERVSKLLCLLRIIPTERVFLAVNDAGRNITTRWVDTLQEVYRKLAPHDAAYWEGLMSMCVELARLLGPVAFKLEGAERRMIGTCYSYVI